MNALLQKHGCAKVFSLPEGLKELMSDITREVLRDQPPNLLEYIANYLAALLITREHGHLAVKILEELCDCKPTLEEILIRLKIPEEQAKECAELIQEEFDNFKPAQGEKLKEKLILKKVLCVVELTAEQATNLCRLLRDIFKDYWAKRQSVESAMSEDIQQEPWEAAAQRTIEIYKTTKPTFEELVRAAEKIQAAYRRYYVRKQMLERLRVKSGVCNLEQESKATNLDVAASREIDLGPKVSLRVPVNLDCLFTPAEIDIERPESTTKVASKVNSAQLESRSPSKSRMIVRGPSHFDTSGKSVSIVESASKKNAENQLSWDTEDETEEPNEGDGASEDAKSVTTTAKNAISATPPSKSAITSPQTGESEEFSVDATEAEMDSFVSAPATAATTAVASDEEEGDDN